MAGIRRLSPGFAPRVARATRIHAVLLAFIGCSSLLSARALAAQSAARCDAKRRVRAVQFIGSPKFDAATLSATIVTQGPTLVSRLLHIGTPACADTLEIQRDALRIAVLHRQAGWFRAGVAARYDSLPNGVRVRFDVTPGALAMIDSLRISGIPAAPEGRAAYDAPLRELRGKSFDRVRVDSAIEIGRAHV